jgi:phosphatidate cytidylyltransferase
VIVAGIDHAREPEGRDRAGGGRSDLATRVAAAAVLAPLALGIAYLGGVVFTLFWGVAALLVWWEWSVLSAGAGARTVFLIGSAALVAAIASALASAWLSVFLCVAGGALLAGFMTSGRRRAAVGGGVLYAGALIVAPVLLRADPYIGFAAIVFVFALVWATDVAAYFAGRAIGGPRLAPRLSPKKTWSGAIGGLAGGAAAAVVIASWAGVGTLPAAALVGAGLSVIAQAGDLFESGFKRCYGAKDSGRLIPGHGGVMDRLDSFIAAALGAAVIGVLRGGFDAPARGLLIW